jgi:hypothetical protein
MMLPSLSIPEENTVSASFQRDGLDFSFRVVFQNTGGFLDQPASSISCPQETRSERDCHSFIQKELEMPALRID